METKPNNENLLGLVAKARSGKVVLPQFQRNFVWSRDDITDLLVSLLEGHFIGSFLMLRSDADDAPFAIRAIQGVNMEPEELQPEWMILDGQQRLTSLNYVFSAPAIPMRWTKYPYRFFLNLKKVAAGNLTEAVWSERTDYAGDWLTQAKQFETLSVPFTILLNGWEDWKDAYEDELYSRHDGSFENYRDELRPAWKMVMKRVENFLVPVIEIEKIPADDADRIAQVCAIFEKLNTMGVRLSVYDLLTARLYKYPSEIHKGNRIDQHELWKEAVEKYPHLNHFSDGNPDEYGVYVLRTIALMRGLDMKSKSLINLKPANYESDWRTAVKYIEKAFERITANDDDGFGAINSRWFPYSTMISPLAAMLHAIDANHLDHRAYKLIKRWYWASIFRERYAGSVESTIYRDFQDFLKVVADPSFEPVAIADARISIVENENFSLRQESRVNAIYRGVMCLIALRGAKDFRADDSIKFHTLEDHHIFPKAYLAKRKGPDGKTIPNDQVNSIVNRTLIADKTNGKISKSSPADYLQKLVPADRKDKIMASHFIDADALDAMQMNDFDGFVRAREKALLAEIARRLTG